MKPRSIAVAAVAIAAAQGLAVLAYRGLSSARGRRAEFVIQPLPGNEELPALEVEARDGVARRLTPGGWRLVHFWATWCPPCRREMPELLALGVEDLELVAVSTDESWDPLSAFFDGSIPAGVVRLRDSAAKDRLGVSTLPDSFLVSPRGRLVARIAGARAWSDPVARSSLRDLMVRHDE